MKKIKYTIYEAHDGNEQVISNFTDKPTIVIWKAKDEHMNTCPWASYVLGKETAYAQNEFHAKGWIFNKTWHVYFTKWGAIYGAKESYRALAKKTYLKNKPDSFIKTFFSKYKSVLIFYFVSWILYGFTLASDVPVFLCLSAYLLFVFYGVRYFLINIREKELTT